MQKFRFEELDLKGSFLIQAFRADDDRGSLIKDYSSEIFAENGINYSLLETFYTVSKRGVIRALHFQRIKEQPKLVRCIKGKIYDVIVDLRPGSDTFKQWRGFYLTGENCLELLIPEHFAHGYLVLEDSIVSYKCAAGFCAEYDDGIIWNDPDIDVNWPLDEIGGSEKIILSDKDRNLKPLCDFHIV